jgi:hypothetical protein
MRRLLLLLMGVVLIPLNGCADDAPVGIPYRPAIIHVRGSVADTAGSPVPGASLTAWAVVWRDFLSGPGPEPFAGCRGRREGSVRTVATDAAGRFDAPVDVPGDVATFCMALEVVPPSPYAPLALALDSLRLRRHASNALVEDTVRVFLVVVPR